MDKKGQALMGGVVMIVTVVILLFISLLVVSKVRSAVDSDLENASYNATSGEGKLDYQDTYGDIKENSNTAFSLTAIALIVLVAFMILTILRA